MRHETSQQHDCHTHVTGQASYELKSGFGKRNGQQSTWLCVRAGALTECGPDPAAHKMMTASQDHDDEVSVASSPQSIERLDVDEPRSRGLSLAALKEATSNMSGLSASVTGWVTVDDQDGGPPYQEYCIVVEYWMSLADAERALAPRQKEAMVRDGRCKVVSKVQRRYNTFRALHDAIAKDFPALRLHAPKRLSFRHLGLHDGDDVLSERVAKLGIFLNDALRMCKVQHMTPPAPLLE